MIKNNKMIKNSIKGFFVAAVFFVLLLTQISFVFGVQGVTRSTWINSTRATFNESSSASYFAQAGNVTELNLAGDQITTHWAGFYGNISGNVTLSDGAGRVFYDWASLGTPAGSVLASNTSSVDWSGIQCANTSIIASVEASLGMVASDADTIVKTYASNNHPDFNVSSTTLSGCNATNAFSSTGKISTAWYQIFLVDTGYNPVYTTLINSSTTSFTGASYDYQLLVGTPSAGSTMFFYIELH